MALSLFVMAVTPAACFAPGYMVPKSRGIYVPKMVAPAVPVVWPDAKPTPSLDQPIRARIVVVTREDVASPFNDRGQAATWLEVCTNLVMGKLWVTLNV